MTFHLVQNLVNKLVLRNRRRGPNKRNKFTGPRNNNHLGFGIETLILYRIGETIGRNDSHLCRDDNFVQLPKGAENIDDRVETVEMAFGDFHNCRGTLSEEHTSE